MTGEESTLENTSFCFDKPDTIDCIYLQEAEWYFLHFIQRNSIGTAFSENGCCDLLSELRRWMYKGRSILNE